MSEIHIQNLTRDYGLGKGIFDISIQVEQGDHSEKTGVYSRRNQFF